MVCTALALPLCLAWRAVVSQASSSSSDWRRCSQDALWTSQGPVSSQFVNHLLPLSCHTDWNCSYLQVEESDMRHCIRPFEYDQTHPTSCTHCSNFIVKKKFEYNTHNSLRSLQWLPCHPSAAVHDFWTAPHLSRKKWCVSFPNHSTVASCLHIDII